jgi:lipoprotein-releasing system permease protein
MRRKRNALPQFSGSYKTKAMMFSPFERMMAWRYLRARKAEGFVSVIATFSFLGIMLGVATLIIVMSVMNGFRTELISRILGLNGHLSVYVPGAPMPDYGALIPRVNSVAGVTNVFPLIESQALLNARGTSTGVVVRGMRDKDFAAKPLLQNSIVEGDQQLQRDRIAIGNKLAENLGLSVGERVLLISPQSKASPFGSMPRSKTYEIAQIFDVGMYEYNAGFIFMTLEDAQVFFQTPNAVTELEVLTTSPDNTEQIQEQLQSLLSAQAKVLDWRAQNSSFVNALDVERSVMFLILTLIIIVAAFNIISSMIMLVKDKARDIAIMRTMGAARNSMLKIFMLTGASIGISGTLVGAVLGILFALNIDSIKQGIEGLSGAELFSDEIYFLSQLPAEIDWVEVIIIVALAITISILATLYPAWRAARLDPVEALRYE